MTIKQAVAFGMKSNEFYVTLRMNFRNFSSCGPNVRIYCLLLMSQIEQPFDFTVRQFIYFFFLLFAIYVYMSDLTTIGRSSPSLRYFFLVFISSVSLCVASFKPFTQDYVYGLIHGIHKQKEWPFTCLPFVT